MPKFKGKGFLEFFRAFLNKVGVNTLIKSKLTKPNQFRPQSFQYTPVLTKRIAASGHGD